MIAVKEREWCFAQYNECCVSQFNDLWEGKDIAPQCQSWYIQCFRVAESACYSYWIDNQVPVHKWVNTIACVKAQKCCRLSLKSCIWFLTLSMFSLLLFHASSLFVLLIFLYFSHCYVDTWISTMLELKHQQVWGITLICTWLLKIITILILLVLSNAYLIRVGTSVSVPQTLKVASPVFHITSIFRKLNGAFDCIHCLPPTTTIK